MKKLFPALLLLPILFLTACSSSTTNAAQPSKGATVQVETITPDAAKRLIESGQPLIILDVRSSEEYTTGHIPKAVLLPLPELAEKSPQVLPDKNQLILVYCRSGRRSLIATKQLSEAGYTNVKDFGGIIDWPYEIEK